MKREKEKKLQLHLRNLEIIKKTTYKNMNCQHHKSVYGNFMKSRKQKHAQRRKDFEAKILAKNEEINKQNETLIDRLLPYFKMTNKRPKSRIKPEDATKEHQSLERPKTSQMQRGTSEKASDGIIASCRTLSKPKKMENNFRCISKNKITEENLRFVKCLVQSKPVINSKALHKQYQNHKSLLKLVRKMTPNKVKSKRHGRNKSSKKKLSKGKQSVNVISNQTFDLNEADQLSIQQ